MRKLPLVLAVACLGAAPLLAEDAPTISAPFVDPEGQPTGSAKLTGTPEGVLVELEISRLPPGRWLAVHIHETGECDPETKFESAGGHFDPTGRSHGYLAEGGPHAGDMPNQYVGSDGVLRADVFNSFVRLGEGDAAIRGRALIVHDGADDYRSQPTGEAGGRLACAVIR